jgi:MFS family permease
MPSTSLLKNTFRSLQHKDFRYFWVGQAVSTIGSLIQVTALSWYVYQISGSPFLLGLMGVFEFGPVLVLSLFVGVLLERFPKKKILLFTQSLFMVQSLVLALLVWQGSTNYWLFAFLALVAGIGASIDQPTRQSYFVELVGKADLPNAISLNSTTFNLARIVGPAIAGIIMKYLGTAECFLINGLSFIPVIYGVSLIGVVGKPRVRDREEKVLKQIKSGVKYAVKNTTILPTFIILVIVCTFSMNASVVLPIFAKDVLLGSESTYSIMMSVFGIGSLFGALFMAGVGDRLRTKNFLVLMAVVMGVAQMLTLLPIPKAYALGYVLVLLVIIGFCNLCFLNRANTRIQLNTDDTYRSRVMSIYVLIVTGSSPLGNTFTGWAIGLTAEKYGFFINGAVSVALVAAIFFIYKKHLHRARVVKD